MMTTAHKARLIQAAALIELTADELHESPQGRTAANLIRRKIGNMPAELAGDVQPAAALVRKALDKASPAVVASAISKRANECKAIVQDAGLPDNAKARALQLLGNATALADKVAEATADRAPSVQQPAHKKAPKAPASKADALDKPDADKPAGFLDKLTESVKNNPIPALALGAGIYFATRPKAR